MLLLFAEMQNSVCLSVVLCLFLCLLSLFFTHLLIFGCADIFGTDKN